MRPTTRRPAKTYKKEEAIKQWSSLPTNKNPLDYMEAIPYKAEGSKYGACGIRIDGTPEFIDAVLGRLKDLLQGENAETRLDLARRAVAPVEIKGNRKTFSNSVIAAEVCYIRLCERGDEAKMVNRVYGMMNEQNRLGL